MSKNVALNIVEFMVFYSKFYAHSLWWWWLYTRINTTQVVTYASLKWLPVSSCGAMVWTACMWLLGCSHEVEGSIPVNVFLFILILYKQLNILGFGQDFIGILSGLHQDFTRTGDWGFPQDWMRTLPGLDKDWTRIPAGQGFYQDYRRQESWNSWLSW